MNKRHVMYPVFVKLTMLPDVTRPWKTEERYCRIMTQHVGIIAPDTVEVDFDKLSDEAQKRIQNYYRAAGQEALMGKRMFDVTTVQLITGSGICVVETCEEVERKIREAHVEAERSSNDSREQDPGSSGAVSR